MTSIGKTYEKHRKIIPKAWETHQKNTKRNGKTQESTGKTWEKQRKRQETQRKGIGKAQEKHKKIIGTTKKNQHKNSGLEFEIPQTVFSCRGSNGLVSEGSCVMDYVWIIDGLRVDYVWIMYG